MKKLNLSRETIRNLAEREMDQIIGGDDPFTCKPHQTFCQVTVTWPNGQKTKMC